MAGAEQNTVEAIDSIHGFGVLETEAPEVGHFSAGPLATHKLVNE